MDSLVYRRGGGRHPKLNPRHQQRLVESIKAGPPVVGYKMACWNLVLIRELTWRECGALYNCQNVCTLLHSLGFIFQKARFL